MKARTPSMNTSYWSHFQLRQMIESDNVLNRTIYFPPGGMSLDRKFWWQAFGMFFFVCLMTQVKAFYGSDLWIASLLVIAIMLSVKQSGAHYNPCMTLSNVLIKFSPQKISATFIWSYFKADFVPAFIAYNIGFYMRGYYSPPPIPITTWDSYSIIISQWIGTFMLTFFLQKICNSQTTFTTSDIETYSFIVVFVYVGRKFAITSANSINPVTTLAAACAAAVQCIFGPLQYVYLYFIGDLLGSLSGSFFYNYVYEPTLRISRLESQRDGPPLRFEDFSTQKKRQPSRNDSQTRVEKLVSDIEVIDESHEIRNTTLQKLVSLIQDQHESSISDNFQLEIMVLKTPQKGQFQS